jgi:hypothetical protein
MSNVVAIRNKPKFITRLFARAFQSPRLSAPFMPLTALQYPLFGWANVKVFQNRQI